MLRPEALVSIYFDEQRPLPTELLYIVLQFSGLVRVGSSSIQFWISWRPARQPAFRSPRLSR
jgi:hypothetical protein